MSATDGGMIALVVLLAAGLIDLRLLPARGTRVERFRRRAAIFSLAAAAVLLAGWAWTGPAPLAARAVGCAIALVAALLFWFGAKRSREGQSA